MIIHQEEKETKSKETTQKNIEDTIFVLGISQLVYIET